ncbi:hypothetical protein KBB48_02385 [Candidatus Shapirobacteria bacterium]|jgi:hypothetical protein|nr:hypothetical protein [Candidatus Shapirobacteria bacterium]
MVYEVSRFSKIKTIIERQILNTLDFLYTDNQITEIGVIKIAKSVLSSIDTASTVPELLKHTHQFTRQYPIFTENIQKTITTLNLSYAD